MNQKMSNKSPIFPIPEPQHFSDYGFDPQIDYFQVLNETVRHERETERSVDSIHFRLQKPISKDESRKMQKIKRKRWWKIGLCFFKWRWTRHSRHDNELENDHHVDFHHASAREFRASISGPVYLTESRGGSSTPHRTSSRPSSSPLAGSLTPRRKGEVDCDALFSSCAGELSPSEGDRSR